MTNKVVGDDNITAALSRALHTLVVLLAVSSPVWIHELVNVRHPLHRTSSRASAHAVVQAYRTQWTPARRAPCL